MAKFKVDDCVYFARCGTEHKEVVCPMCSGKKTVVLILGNGDQVTLPCEGCGLGYDGPRGYIKEWTHIVGAEATVVTRVITENYGTGENVKYQCLYNHSFPEEQLFATKEEALAVAQKMKAKKDEEQETKAEYLKHKVEKNYAWNARYHLREAKENRRQAEYHDSKAILCKARAKE